MNEFSNQPDSQRSNSIGRFADVGVSVLNNSARRNSQEIVGNDYTEQNSSLIVNEKRDSTKIYRNDAETK